MEKATIGCFASKALSPLASVSCMYPTNPFAASFSTTLSSTTLSSSSHLLLECLPTFLGQIVDLASQCPEDVLPVVLDALCQVARADKAITGQFADRLVPLTMELFKKYSHGEGGRREGEGKGEDGRGRGGEK